MIEIVITIGCHTYSDDHEGWGYPMRSPGTSTINRSGLGDLTRIAAILCCV
jgi:hypothetical protein